MDEERWVRLADGVDRGVFAIWDAYSAGHPIAADQLAEGFSTLGALRLGREPEYGSVGTAAAYVLVYMVQRTASIALALDAAGLRAEPLRVLDIGAGTGATALALRLIGRHTDRLTCVEPSAEMRSFIPLKSGLDVAVEATLEGVLAQETLAGERYDVVVLSACLPYGWRPGSGRTGVAEFGAMLRNRLVEGGTIVLIEPPAKSREAEVAAAAFRLVDMDVRRSTVAELVGGGAVRLPARRTTRALERERRRIARSGRLTDDGADLLGRRWAIETSAASPDVVVIAIARGFAFRAAPRERTVANSPGLRRAAPAHPTDKKPAGKERALPPRGIALLVLTAIAITAAAAWIPYDFWR